MSNLIANAAPLFITAPVRKSLSIDAPVLSGIVQGMIKAVGNDAVRPSNVAQCKDGAKAAMGSKMTPFSFVNGLCWLLACYANGQGNKVSLSAGLTPLAVHAFDHATNLMACGKGVTATQLHDVVISSMLAVVALPSKSTAPKVGALSAPLVVAPGATVEGEIIAAEVVAKTITLDPISEAKAIAFADAQEQAASEQEQAATIAATTLTQQAEFIRLAVMLGIELTSDQQNALGMRKAA